MCVFISFNLKREEKRASSLPQAFGGGSGGQRGVPAGHFSSRGSEKPLARSGWQGPLGRGAGHKDVGGGGKASAAAEQKGGSAATYISAVNLADSPLDSSRSHSWWNATLASWERDAPRPGSAGALAKAGGNEATAGGTRVGAWEGQNQAKLWEMVGGGIQV